MTVDFSAWTAATGNLTGIQQRAFLDVLNLVAEGKSHLAHAADYRDGKPCLVNHVGHMLSVGGGQGIPSRAFNALVTAFDRTNQSLAAIGVNANDGFVSPLAAETLIRNFGELRPVVASDAEWEAARQEVVAPSDQPSGPYREPSDDEFNSFLLTMASDATVTDADVTVDAPSDNAELHNR